MKMTLRKAAKFTLLMLAIIQSSRVAQAQNEPREVLAAGGKTNTPGCKAGHRTVPFTDTRLGNDGKILPGQVLVRARVVLDADTTATVVERPRYGEDLDSYNSTIVVKRGQKRTKYSIGHLIKNGSGLRLVEIASLCSSPDQGTVILAFEAGSTGAAEGFAVIRVSPDEVYVQTFPMVNQGRIVISKANPDQVELWSATAPATQIDCDACKKRYAVQDCSVGRQSVECKQRPGPGEVLLPDKFMRARIAVQ